MKETTSGQVRRDPLRWEHGSIRCPWRMDGFPPQQTKNGTEGSLLASGSDQKNQLWDDGNGWE